MKRETDLLESELITDCGMISESITHLRAKIESYLNSADNIDGCLIGTVDEFMPAFDE